ncbi:MAG: 3-deoxy-D-manno-octulosonic acid transferase, partial [Leptospiraceae bacterium]|nr:3-deoxy-D-manno-octulosonic acid transferase [Leptospiraceae bacterium]
MFTKDGRIFLKNRKNLKTKLKSFQRRTNSKVYWFHAASVGELEQCKAVIEVIRGGSSNSIIIQSVYSSSVTDQHLESPLFDFVFYLPLDFFWAYDSLFQTFQPNAVMIAAWDTWFNFLRKAKQYNSKTFLICATIHSHSSRLLFPFSLLTKKIFSYIDFVLPANELFQKEFERIIPKEKIGIFADSRFDAVIQKIEKRKSQPPLPKTSQKIIILASTYKEDEDLLLPILPKLLKEFTVWVFPHKLEEKNLKRIQENLKKLNLVYVLYSNVNFEHVQNLVLFDKLGILAHAYEKGFYTYVGGALHNRVHNVIE